MCPITEGWEGRRIARHLKLEPPYQRRELVEFFTVLVDAYDRTRNIDVELLPPERKPQGASVSKLTNEDMIQLIAKMDMEGRSSAEIRGEIRRLWGREISPSYMSHLRKRTRARVKL